jgi:hypothetical protein
LPGTRTPVNVRTVEFTTTREAAIIPSRFDPLMANSFAAGRRATESPWRLRTRNIALRDFGIDWKPQIVSRFERSVRHAMAKRLDVV